ncbi:GNAT family N-acetyltransferase [Actinocatenispora comari]|uniref:GNAT family N-acetyltransferase n=1 Tax=Actinocatenispora comari TaxID=2807577 RepID=UPI00351A5344
MPPVPSSRVGDPADHRPRRPIAVADTGRRRRRHRRASRRGDAAVDADGPRPPHDRLPGVCGPSAGTSVVEPELARLTRAPGPDHAAVAAQLGDELVGVGSYERLDSDTAELAVLVAEHWQGRGIGTGPTGGSTPGAGSPSDAWSPTPFRPGGRDNR